VDSFRDYITDLQDLPSNEEFPHRIVKEQGIWSLICREMEVKLRFRLYIVHSGAAEVDSGREGADSDAAAEPAGDAVDAEPAADEGGGAEGVTGRSTTT